MELVARSSEAAITTTASDVFEGGFDEVLYDCYDRADGNVRAALTVAQQALQETIDRGEEIVSLAALREAALGIAV
jgi:hypothetical protein